MSITEIILTVFIAAVCVWAVCQYFKYLERRDIEWVKHNPEIPDQQQVAAEHCEKVGAKVRNIEQSKNVRYLRDWEMVRRHDAETERRLMAHIHGMHQGDKP
jgi:hypothetical protein